MSNAFDLVVIGTGSAATAAATTVRDAGWRVAVIDHRPYGGTCALRGCDPKKVLVGAARTVDRARRMRVDGVTGDARIDWPALMTFKRGFTDPVPEERLALFTSKGITPYRGWAQFTGANALRVGDDELQAQHFLIAAGAEPVRLPIPGAEHLVTSEQFLTLETLPPRIVLVGGGYIAAEMSYIAACAGAKVTILQRADRMLTQFDPEPVGWLMASFRAHGIEVRLGAEVEGIEKNGADFRVSIAKSGRRETIEADLVMHAAGRAPALEPLNPGAANIVMEKGRLKLNEYLQSVSNPSVYAAGDAAQAGPPLTPVSSYDARIVAANLLRGNHRKPNYAGVPSVAFTIPPIAGVGLDEARARAQGLHFRINSRLASEWYTARQQAQPVYGFKVLIEDGSERILGAHLVGPHCDEVINIFALAVRHGLSADALRDTIFSYPTGTSDIGSML